MLTPAECLEALALEMVPLDAVEGAHHGPQHDKWFQFQRQHDGIFARVGRKDLDFAVLIAGYDRARFTALLVRQVQRNLFGIEMSALYGLMRGLGREKAVAAE